MSQGHTPLGFSDTVTAELPFLIAGASTERLDALEMPTDITRAFMIRLISQERPAPPVGITSLPELDGPSLTIALTYISQKARRTGRFQILSRILYLSNEVAASGHLALNQQHVTPENFRGIVKFTVSQTPSP